MCPDYGCMLPLFCEGQGLVSRLLIIYHTSQTSLLELASLLGTKHSEGCAHFQAHSADFRNHLKNTKVNRYAEKYQPESLEACIPNEQGD